MCTRLFKSEVDLPAADEPDQDLFRFDGIAGTDERLRIGLALRISRQYLVQQHHGKTAAVPDGGASGDLDGLVILTAPLGQCHAAPTSGFAGHSRSRGALSCCLAAWPTPTPTAGCSSQGRIKQRGVESKMGDDA